MQLGYENKNTSLVPGVVLSELLDLIMLKVACVTTQK